MKICVKIVRERKKKFNGAMTLKIFAMHVLKNCFSSRFGRVEFFTNNNAMAMGGDRVAAREVLLFTFTAYTVELMSVCVCVYCRLTLRLVSTCSTSYY
jgi:hypothetical protein